MYRVALTDVVKQFRLKNLTPEISLEDRWLKSYEIARPGLPLSGYYAHFQSDRVQLVGNMEYSYILTMNLEERRSAFRRLFSTNIPCLILCHGNGTEENSVVAEEALKHNVPIFQTQEQTSRFSAELVQYLAVELAPRASLHGVMMDCFGEGVLIQGESGFGKSETALELVQRGHRLVADDVVEIRRINDHELMAQPVEVIRNLLELRGVGIINVKELYGVQSVRLSKSVDMVVKLEQWQMGKNYDRIGLQTETTEVLGNQVPCYSIPLMAGRNVAMIIEAAALNNREKKMGDNAAEDFIDRVNANIERRKHERDREARRASREKEETL